MAPAVVKVKNVCFYWESLCGFLANRLSFND